MEKLEDNIEYGTEWKPIKDDYVPTQIARRKIANEFILNSDNTYDHRQIQIQEQLHIHQETGEVSWRIV